MHQTGFNGPLMNPILNKELSSIMDDASLFNKDNSFISKNNTQVLMGLNSHFDKDATNINNLDKRNELL